MNRIFASLCVFLFVSSLAIAQPFKPGQAVDVSLIMTERGWQAGCTFVSGPHPENNGYNIVKCGTETTWAASKWIRPASPAAARAAIAPAVAAPAAVAQANPGQPCGGTGHWADCFARAAAPSAGPAAHLVTGKYPCYGNGRYVFMDMAIKSNSVYLDSGGHPGNYTFDAASQKITFTSGSLKGTNSKLLPVNRIGLTNTNDNFYATTCELQK